MDKAKIFYIIATYKFFSWPKNTNFTLKAQELQTWCSEKNIKGLLLIGSEGLNGTLACPSLDTKKQVTKNLELLCAPQKLDFKESTSKFQPFRRMKVKAKKEIVTLGAEELIPDSKKGSSHLSPEEWNDFIKSQNPLVLDVRNDYEMEIGKFKTAKDWSMQEFVEFPKLVEKLEADKKQPVLMYCTGGIRCEKASLEMRRQGYTNVYQLDGGILNYLKKFPKEEFEGECFVFDHRVAVDQNLAPSKNYDLCVHCGQPAKLESFACIQCQEPSLVCQKCLDTHLEDESIQTCSKNCRYHKKMGHRSKRLHKDSKRNYKKTKSL